MSSDPQIDGEIQKLTALAIWPKAKLPHVVPDPFYLAGFRPETLAMITADLERNKRAVDFQAFLCEILDLTSRTLRETQHYSTPFPTLADWQEKAKESTIAQINNLMEEADINLDRIKEAITILATTINPETKQRVLNSQDRSINFRRGNQSWCDIKIYSEPDWEKYEEETNQKLQMLQVGLSFFEKLRVIFLTAIKDREARKPEILRKIDAARKLSSEAEKIIEKISKADLRCKETNCEDTKAVKEFANGWRKLEELEAQFSTLKGSGVEFMDFGNPQPIFPSLGGFFTYEGDDKRKAKIFQIFEKSQRK